MYTKQLYGTDRQSEEKKNKKKKLFRISPLGGSTYQKTELVFVINLFLFFLQF